MHDKNEQDAHLSGLIEMKNVGRRRPRDTPENLRKTKCACFSYKIRYNGDEIKLCQDAFIKIHAVTPARIRRLQTSLVTVGKSPRDSRGLHENRPTKFPIELTTLIKIHIMSFQPRQSHYSRRKNPNMHYLPENLTVKEMHNMFISEYKINIPYKIYWFTFRNSFSIKFGFPRSDTCAECDMYTQKLNDKAVVGEELNSVTAQKELHLRKAETFFALRRKYKTKAQAGEVECLTFDYMQNLPLPHIPTNPVFYARQLWYYVFGVHNLATNEATIYTYHEGVAKKGCNDVTSMILHYINNHQLTAKTLVLISDGCPGQNKNYVMVHFIYFLVHVLKLFDEVIYIFPVRGHSYLPNDQDFALIEKKKRRIERVELPNHWDRLIKKARVKPSQFEVVKMDQHHFFNIKSATENYFLKAAKPPLQIKKIREMIVKINDPTISVRDSYNGFWRSSIIRNKVRLPDGITLERAYDEPVKIAPLKITNLKTLLQYLERPENKLFYEQIFEKNETIMERMTNNNDCEVDEDDNSSGCDDN